jgi:hypothetical protein
MLDSRKEAVIGVADCTSGAAFTITSLAEALEQILLDYVGDRRSIATTSACECKVAVLSSARLISLDCFAQNPALGAALCLRECCKA